MAQVPRENAGRGSVQGVRAGLLFDDVNTYVNAPHLIPREMGPILGHQRGTIGVQGPPAANSGALQPRAAGHVVAHDAHGGLRRGTARQCPPSTRAASRRERREPVPAGNSGELGQVRLPLRRCQAPARHA